MLVDDAPFIVEIERSVLESAGYEIVAEASNGEEAVMLAERVKPDLILMDMVMPKKSGVEAATMILEKAPKTRIIAVSTLDQESMVMKAIEAGCESYIVKPFEKTDILEAVASK